jgi:hypothetical protein
MDVNPANQLSDFWEWMYGTCLLPEVQNKRADYLDAFWSWLDGQQLRRITRKLFHR